MTQASPAVFKIPAKSPQAARRAVPRPAPSQVRSAGAGRPATRGGGEAATEEKLAAKLQKVMVRLAADAPNMKTTGADLIAHYLDPDRLPVSARWSRKHAHTQRRLCERFAAPVIASVACQDIKTEHTQAIVNAAPTAGEGDRVRGMISALVSAGVDGGYLANPRLEYRRTIYPRRTPGGYPLADKLAARTEEARAEQAAGTSPLGLLGSPRQVWRLLRL